MKKLDLDVLKKDTSQPRTIELLREIELERERILRENVMSEDDTLLSLELNGFTFSVRRSNAFSALETYYEIFHKDNHFLHKDFIPKNSDVVVDFGANEGYYIARLKKFAHDCKIYAFEPNPHEFQLLKSNVENNHFQNVTLEQCAIFSHETELEFEFIPQIGTIGSLNIHIPQRKWLKEEFIQRIKIQAFSADQILEKYKLDHIHIMKIDVEGAELEILENFHAIDRVDKITVEYHSEEIRLELLNLMKHRHFNLVYTDMVPGDYYGDLYFTK